MKVLVTGGTGFIGSHLVDRLLEEGHSVRCLVRRMSNRQWLAGRGLELVECEQVGERAVIRQAVEGVDLVLHVLGTLVAPTLEAFRQVNVEPVRMILDACLERGGLERFVLVGSLGAAGPNLGPEGLLRESDPCRPVSAYGRSKLEAEEVTRQYQGKVPYTIVRLSAVYGPRDLNLLTIFKSAVKRGVVPQVGRQAKALSLVHVRDATEGICRAATARTSLSETYFLASEGVYSMQDVAGALAVVLNKKIKVRVIPDLVVKGMMLYADLLSRWFKKDILLNRDRLTTLSYPRWACDVSKARADLGYRQTVSLEDGFRETFEWYRQAGWL
jgi:nucleoside-diphosphate-sugar epimerase